MERLMRYQQKPTGHVFGKIEYLDGSEQFFNFQNTILMKGRGALAKSLANEIDTTYSFFISRMLFGDGGTSGGSLKFVNAGRNGLFGTTRANKNVISSINAENEAQVILTSVLTYNDANGYALNEMALQMDTGDLYSMVTFPDMTKTDRMQITYNWYIDFA
jgi:hypothetical protein